MSRYVKFENTDEERKIKWIVRGAWSLNSPYCFVEIDGKEAMLLKKRRGANHMDRETLKQVHKLILDRASTLHVEKEIYGDRPRTSSRERGNNENDH